MRRWRKWRGVRLNTIGAMVHVTCLCGDVFRLEQSHPDYPPRDRAHCLGCDREWKLVVRVETRTAEGAEDG